MIDSPRTCQSCGSSALSRGTLRDSYVADVAFWPSEYQPPALSLYRGFPVNVYVCLDCGHVIMHVDAPKREIIRNAVS